MGIDTSDGVDDAEEKLHIAIKEVREELEKILTTKETLIKKLGHAFENARFDHSNICQEIKNVLRNEIAQGLITRRLIELYCPDKWKRKTKPKIEKEDEKISFAAESIVQPMIIETSGSVIPQTENVESPYNHSNSNTDLETEEIELDDIESCNIKNSNFDTKYSNNKEHQEFDITIPLRIVRKYILDPLHKQGRKNLLVHGTIDNRTSLVISAWVTGVQEIS